ncbi:MAG: aldehyde:ferredoxin oxidoreductase, partial [Proteobacteria bacterium]|nr:aldehyde:ferredoxin oxidoreductase [Pseudomonadota bacterium]
MSQINLKEIKAISYKRAEIKNGYTDQSLRVNLDSNDIIINPIKEEIKNKFIGGKGYDLWLMWNAVSGDTKWNDPENAICISSGPLGGTPGYPGGGKSIVTAISPLTGAPIDSNVGGYFGPYKKFSGFDVIQIDGKAKKDTIIFIDGIE